MGGEALAGFVEYRAAKREVVLSARRLDPVIERLSDTLVRTSKDAPRTGHPAVDLAFYLGMLGRLFRRKDPSALSEAALNVMQGQLVRGELREAQAELLLKQRAERHDDPAVRVILDHMASLGMRSPTTTQIATEFFLAHREYEEAHRYALDLCYEHDRFGPALRQLAILETLRGDYLHALQNFDAYLERHKADPLLIYMHVEALLRSGSTKNGLEHEQRFGNVRPDVTYFWNRIATGHRLPRFSWRGRPTKKGELFHGKDVTSMQTFLRTMIREPLQYPVKSLTELDQRLSQGHYISDRNLFGPPEVWQAPLLFEQHMAGDCEDFALWAWVNLIRLGFPARFTLGGVYEDTPNHAWVTVHRHGMVFVLECTPQPFHPLVQAQHASEYRPMWSVDKNLHWYAH